MISAKLDRSKKGIVKQGASIRSIRTLDGQTIHAKMFIDATYEGDLLALAGVSYTIGREPSSRYGEPGNGIQPGHHSNQLPRGIDPYIIPKDPSSGLLPGVNPNTGGAKGDGDDRVQAYCYRMCLTNHGPNKIRISATEPNQIDYGTIVPKRNECDNLFATFAVSASHIAFGPIRMEPVFRVLSQSATTAAIAIDSGIPVQDVPYEVLQKRLLADGQKLSVAEAQ